MCTCMPNTHALFRQSAEGPYYRAESSETRSHTAYMIFQTLQDVHVKRCIDSFIFRNKFVVRNFMAVNHHHHKHDHSDWFLPFFLVFIQFGLFSFHYLLCDFPLMWFSQIQASSPGTTFGNCCSLFSKVLQFLCAAALVRSQWFRHHLGGNLSYLVIFS